MSTIRFLTRSVMVMSLLLLPIFDRAVVAQETPPDESSPPELSIGNVAPAIEIDKWTKGDPVDGFANGHVYVVEFWATWCGPCRAGMPHISQLQDKYRDAVTFIGVTREKEETVNSFMDKVQNAETGKTWNEVITYSIALDRNSATNNAYMKAAEQSGIPTAFVVGKDGIIEWIGHPMGIDQPLAKIVGDQWDREAAATQFVAEQAAKRARRELSIVMRAARKSGDWAPVIETVDKLMLKNPDVPVFANMKLEILVMAERYDEAHAVASDLVEQVWDDAQFLNAIAWALVTRVPSGQQNHDLAMRTARRASSLTNDQDGAILDTVARVFFEKGDLESAIEWQKKAVAAAPDMAQLQKALQKYESAVSADAKN